MKTINIIGAGMAGSILAKLLRREQIPFRIFDCNKPSAASPISENLIGTNWYTAEERRKALGILDLIVPIRFIDSKTKAYQVYVSDLLEKVFYKAEVSLRTDGTFIPEYHGKKQCFYEGINVDCRGVWAAHHDVKAMTGHGILYPPTNYPLEESITTWAPFRHAKLIKLTPHTWWFGNSTVIRMHKYTMNEAHHKKVLLELAQHFVPIPSSYSMIRVGHRPMTPKQEVIENENGYVMTGGYKSGLVAYPIMAQKLIETLKQKHL